jgi:hypothetical protein
MFPVLRPILNRGGAGYSISRQETIDRLKPHVERGLELSRAYASTLPRLDARDAVARLEALMPYLRTEIGKLYETIFSAGGTAPTGVGLRDELVPADDDTDPLTTLTRLERRFGKALRDEVDSVHHQERTRAILRSVAAGSDGRLDVLREMAVRK